MHHSFMAAMSEGLCDRGVATLRYQFPYMQRRSKRPDAPALCHDTVRVAVAVAMQRAQDVPLFAGGKSFGGRMTSQTQALAALPGVHGLIFVGFPLHPAGKPADSRGSHLSDVHVPMLFLQGDRDELATLDLLRPLIERLGNRAKLQTFEHADHSFHVPARSGRNDAEVRSAMLDVMRDWMAASRSELVSPAGKPYGK
jgi:predicted alpha/beta-hydrolase family hydrolase